MMRASFSALVVFALAAAVLLAARPVHAQEPGAYQKLLADKAPALVTVKFVLKMKMGGFGDQENESEITGVVISPEGLVVCSNTQLGGIAGLFGRLAGQELSSQPTDLKVLAGDDTEGLEAEFLARDTELDLAWIRVKKPGDRKYAFVDLGKAARPAIGEPVCCVHRLDKYFDRVAVVVESRIGGIARKPRELYVPTTDASSSMGLPVYTLVGDVVGLLIMQMPEMDEGGENPMAMLTRMSSLRDMASLILPAAEVVKATQRALETAQTRPAGAGEGAATRPAKGRSATYRLQGGVRGSAVEEAPASQPGGGQAEP